MSKISSPLIQKIFDQEIFRYSTQLLTFPNSISMHASKSTFHNLPDQNLHKLIVRDEKEMIFSLRNQLYIKTHNKETGKETALEYQPRDSISTFLAIISSIITQCD